MSDAKSRKAVFASIFKRRGGDGRYTRLFDNLDAGQQQTLLQNAEVGDGELPIVGSIEAPDRWFILTTHKLAWRRGDRATVLSMDEIVDAIADLRALREQGRSKLEMGALEVMTRVGKHTIDVEPGAPLSGVWSVLKNVGARNRRGRHGSRVGDKP